MTAIPDAEWPELASLFPNLDKNTCRKTGPATTRYNCIAWTLGLDSQWIDPPEPQFVFEAYYARFGFEVCPLAQGTIDGWGFPAPTPDGDETMTHGSILNVGQWESKVGGLLRMTHPREGLGSRPRRSAYGDILVSFRKRAAVTATTSVPTATMVADKGSTTGETDGGAAKVTNVVTTLNDAFRAASDEFETKFLAWKATWFSQAMSGEQSSAARAKGKEWDALVQMSAKILPLVVDKLKSPEDCFAVQLYNELQTDTNMKVPKTDIITYYNLNLHAKKIIELYSTHVLTPFDSEVSEWKAHASSPSADYDAYLGLTALGKDQVIPLVMAKYSQDQNGRWHDLLYELEHGKRPGLSQVKKEEQYQNWKTWFEAGAGGTAPAA